ncbi:50S ribosomal protein L4, partial [archaeon]|nr:50S ribosomal protein L4 [archaeon]
LDNLDKTKEVRKAFQEIGVWDDVEKAIAKRQIRPGIGKKRGRMYKKRKSVLIVAGNTEKIYKGARNLEGVDIVSVNDLNANLLAPGTLPGRLTLWSENAIKELGKEKATKETSTGARNDEGKKVGAKV